VIVTNDHGEADPYRCPIPREEQIPEPHGSEPLEDIEGSGQIPPKNADMTQYIIGSNIPVTGIPQIDFLNGACNNLRKRNGAA
jgi:hypothetical protein